MTGRRPERLAEQIREEVSLIISGELDDPRVALVTVTDARVSPDLKYAKIFVSVLGDEHQTAQAIAALNHAAAFVRHRLGGALRVKRTPELRFFYDETARNAARIEELLSEEVGRAKEDESEKAEPAAGGE
jgi:ribosome-binding factor A